MKTTLLGRVLAALAILAAVPISAVGQTTPLINSATAYNVGGGTAILNANVSAGGATTSVYFQYGLTGSYGSTTGTTSFPSAAVSASDNAESYSSWTYGTNGGTGFGPATYLEGAGGGIFLVSPTADAGRQIDGNNSLAVFSGGATGNSQAMDRQIINALSAGTLSMSCRFDVSNTVAFSGFNLKYAQGTHFGDQELISVGLTPTVGVNAIAINGGAQTINLGSSIPGQIIDFKLTYDCIAGTYTLGAKFRASGTYTTTSGNLKLPASAAAVPVVAEYLGFGNFNTGNSQNFIADDVLLNTSSLAATGTLAISSAISGITADTTYHYRAVATNSQGTAFGGDQTLGFPLQPLVSATYQAVDDGSGDEARIYSGGHIALAEPDLNGNPFGIVEVFTPPLVVTNAATYAMGPVLSSTSITNGYQFTQSLAGTVVTTQLTFPSTGVARYQVTNWNGIIPASTDFVAGSGSSEHFFGFGEKFNSVDQTGNKVHMLTFDNPGTKGDHSYKPVPFFMSNNGYGFHLGTTAESWFDMRNSATDRYTIQNLDGNLVMNLIAGPKLTNVLSRFTGYIGRPFLPPAWVFGPWISCDIWPTGGEVRYAVNTWLQDGIPLSAIVFDSPWETDYNDLTWNTAQFQAGGTLDAGGTWAGFSTINNMMTYLQQNGTKVLCWMTPFTDVSSANQNINGEPVGQNNGQASNYAAGLTNNYFVMTSSTGPALTVPWWGGTGSPIDFTNSSAVAWFQGELTSLINQSNVTTASGGQEPAMGGFKTDDGESGNGTNTYIPTTAYYSNGQTGIDMQNGYCIQYHKSVSSVLGTNGVVMSRGGFAGTGAFPGCWAGDNEPNFGIEGDGLNSVVIAGASAGLSGFSMWGSDVGGYLSGPFESDPADLFQRWTQFGCFSPIMELHRTVSASNLQQYPWGYGATALSNFVTYAKLHVQLFPYIYSYAYEASQDGLPIIRAPVLLNQTDTGVYALNQTYYFGNEFLVAPMNALDATSRGIYLPAGKWYDYWTQASYSGSAAITWTNSDPTKIPLFVKSGSIIPMLLNVPQSLCTANYVNNSAVSTMDSGLQFLIYPGTGTASFNMYDATTIQSNVAGTVTNVSLSSTTREIALKVLTSTPAGVQRNGVRMPQFASMGAYTSGTLGWIYSGGFLYVKFNHGGGAANIGFSGDTIGDGVPDSWRTYYGVSNDQADTDGTGMTNLQKYLAGLNPNDPSSRFTVQTSGAGNTLTWQAQPGLTYQVQSSTNLAPNSWQNVGPIFTGTGGAQTWTDPNPVSTQMFYRIVIPN